MSTYRWILISGALLASCDDESTSVPPDTLPVDPPPVDARPDAIVEDYDSDEGGEVRVEYIRHANGTGVGTRTTAFFYKDSGTQKYFQYLDLDGCTDMKAGGAITRWPMAQNPPEQRTYEDVGPYVVLTGGPAPLIVNKNTTGTPALDPFARAHGANNWYADNVRPN